MKNNVDFSNSEQGVRLYKLHADCFNPLTFWLTEEWNTVSDLKNHFLSESYIKNAELTAGKVLKQYTSHQYLTNVLTESYPQLNVMIFEATDLYYLI